MQGKALAALVLASVLLAVVSASSLEESNDADVYDGLQHLTAAERKMLGYILVKGDRKNWINRYHHVHPLSGFDEPEETPAAASSVAPASTQVIYKYKRFPMEQILEPLSRLARSVRRQRIHSWKRYLRLRQLLLRRGLLNKTSDSNLSPTKAAAIRSVLGAPAASPEPVQQHQHEETHHDDAPTEREIRLRRRLHALRREIARRERMARLRHATPHCSEGSVYFCRKGRCACTAEQDAVCSSSRRLRCRAADEVGRLCRCVRDSSLARRRAAAAAAVAATRAKGYWRTCNVRFKACRHAREVQRRLHYGRWTSRRRYLNKQYRRMYRRYVELLARYFKKKYRIMIRHYVRQYKANKNLKGELKALLSKHKEAMLHHAKLHHLAFMRYSQLMASYKALDAKYNALVDKYQVDMDSTLNRLEATRKKLAAQRRKVHKLRAKNAQLDAKIKFLESEVERHKALNNHNAAVVDALNTKHQALKAEFARHKKIVAAALKAHETLAEEYQNEIADQKAQITALQNKLDEAKQNAADAAENAKKALKAAVGKYKELKKQAADAQAHDQAALEALQSKNNKLRAKVATLRKELSDKDKNDHAAERIARLVKKAAKEKADADAKISSLRSKLRKALDNLKTAEAALKARMVDIPRGADVAPNRGSGAVRAPSAASKPVLGAEKPALAPKAPSAPIAPNAPSSSSSSSSSAPSNTFTPLKERALIKHYKTINKRLQQKFLTLITHLRRNILVLKRKLSHLRSRRASAKARLRKWKRILHRIRKQRAALTHEFVHMKKKYNDVKKFAHAEKEEIVELRQEVAALRASGKGKSADDDDDDDDDAKKKSRRHHRHHRLHYRRCGHTYSKARKANQDNFAHRFAGYEFYKIKVDGPMTSENIANACASVHLQVPCEHRKYSDKRCTVVTRHHLHFSLSHHRHFPSWLLHHTYWYTNRAESLLSTRHGHRWSTESDNNGYTMCVLPKPCKSAKAVWHHHSFYRVRVPGHISNKAIAKACHKHGLDVPCDHPSLKDGTCVVVSKRSRHHLSRNVHNRLPHKLAKHTFWYTGKKGKTPYFHNKHNSHIRAISGQRDGLTLCVARHRHNHPKRVIAKWHGYKWHRVRVHGRVTSRKIAQACHKHGLHTPCDHPAYADGHCTAVTKRGIHLSFAPHHKLPARIINHMYFYTGASRAPLQSLHHSHRWAGRADRHGSTLCIERAHIPNPKRVVAKWHGFNFYKVLVPGQVSNEKIAKACTDAGYLTPCDHPAYDDDKCTPVTTRNIHMSYNPHHNFPRKVVKHTYWYTGEAKAPLENWHNTHRWAATGDRDVVTLCAKENHGNSPKSIASWHGYRWVKVPIEGHVSNAAIAKACAAKKLQVPCDHIAYADGNCVAVMKQPRHLSYAPHHDLNRHFINKAFFYTGGSGRKPLQNWHHTHRWAPAHAKGGHTICIERLPPKHTGYKFTFNGFKFYRVRVHGQMTPHAVRAACNAQDLFTPCDHPAYADGHCVAVTKSHRHLSYNPHHALNRQAMDRCYFYAGKHNKLLENWHNTHRWSGVGDFDGDAMCVIPEAVDSNEVAAQWKGYTFHKVLVQGPMTNENILEACSSNGYKTPCDTQAYNDGKCEVIDGKHHMSYNSHHNFPRKVIDRTYWYTGTQRAPLQNWHNTHRWAAAGDMWETTLCIE